jgi:DNA-binding CsgD family transcriptional regulator
MSREINSAGVAVEATAMEDVVSTPLVCLIEHAYDAALDAEKWPEFLKLVSEHFRDASTILWHTDGRDVRLNVFASYRYEQSSLQSLQDHYFAVNPWVPKKMVIPSGNLHRTEALYAEEDLQKTEFYSDWLVPNNLFKGFGISLFNDHRFAFLSIIRSRRAGAPSAEELRLLDLLTPHLQRAIQLHERFHSPPFNAEPALAVLDGLARGVIFLGRDGRSTYCNPAAVRILSRNDGLVLDRNGRCRTADPSDHTALSRLIDSAVAGQWWRDRNGPTPRSGGAMAVSRMSARRPYGLVVAPLPRPRSRFGFAQDQVAAVVFISDTETEAPAQLELLRSHFGLSRKEAELAARLSTGEKLASVAEELGITYETARTYLKSVFAKLGVSRQTELVGLVESLTI